MEKKVIGLNIKMIRLSQNITVKAMAKGLGITDSAYRSYENGDRNPSAKMLYNISILLGCNMETFFIPLYPTKCGINE